MCSAEVKGERRGKWHQSESSPTNESNIDWSWVVRRNMLFKALTLPNQRPLQYDAALLVSLTVFGSKLVDPTQLAIAVLAADISHHVPASKHHSVLHLAILQVYHLWGWDTNKKTIFKISTWISEHVYPIWLSFLRYLIKEESSASGSCEARGDKLRPIGQDGVTVGTRKQACSTNVVQENASHRQISGIDWTKAKIWNSKKIGGKTTLEHYLCISV